MPSAGPERSRTPTSKTCAPSYASSPAGMRTCTADSSHETPRQRFHIDVWVPPEVAEQRIAAAVTAGGIIADDSQAPSYTMIADPDGNKACVCTTQDR